MNHDSTNDAIVEAFLHNYGMVAALKDVGIDRMQKTNEDNVITVCPFHDDHKPSFGVNLKNGLFQCFSCSAHGNLYTFIQLAYSLDFKKAKEYILMRSGLSESGINIENIVLKRDLDNLIKKSNQDKALDFKFPEISPEMISRMYQGPDPHNYLLNRNFKESTINYFECGYTRDYLGHGYDSQERVTIPGHDEFGNICGFIGRTPINAIPKYLYTSGYPKSHTLFNLHRAAKYADKGLIVCEGSLDVMRLHDLGYPNACAILGAKLSEYQFILLRNYTNDIYLMFDSDEAGIQASLTAFDIVKDSLNVHFVPLKNYKDPGEVLDSKTLDSLLSNCKNWRKYSIHEGVRNNVARKNRK